jgi:TPR repeat protein/ankyrin repeat protein
MTTNKNQQTEKNKALLAAASDSDFDEVANFVEQGADPAYGFRGQYVLNELFFQAPIECIEQVFSHFDAPLEPRKGFFDNIISYFRPAQEQIRIIDLLIESGVTVDPDDAAQSVIDALKGFPSATDNSLEETEAVAYGPLKKLLALGMNPNFVETGDDGETLLFLSVYAHAPAMVKTLIEHGADPNLATRRGLTSMMMASGSVYNYAEIWRNSKSKQEIVLYLLQHGADPSLKSRARRNALSYAKASDNWRIVELLEQVAKTGEVPAELPDVDKEGQQEAELEAFEAETNQLVAGKDCNDGWPIEDKSWFKKRRDQWKYVQQNIQPISHHNTKRKSYAALKKYYVSGTPLPKDRYYLELLYKLWFHPSGDPEVLKAIAYENVIGLDSSVSMVFSKASSSEFKPPYGMLGPRSSLLAQVLAELYFPLQDNPLKQASPQLSARFLTYFCQAIPACIGKYENDPYRPHQYLVDYVLQSIDYIYQTDELAMLDVKCASFIQAINDYDPNVVPDYKRQRTDALVKQIKQELENGLYDALTYNGITDPANKSMVTGSARTDSLWPMRIGKMYEFTQKTGKLLGQQPIRLLYIGPSWGERYVATLRPDQYVLNDLADDSCQIGVTSEFHTQSGEYVIEFLQTTNEKLLSEAKETGEQEWVNDISDKLQSIVTTREEKTRAVSNEIDEADHYFYQDDYAAAILIYQKYAEQGYTDAVFGLAECYENGSGVEVDLAEAEKLYRDCAEKGLLEAQEQLAFLLAGKSEENYHEALKWIFVSTMNISDRLGGSDYDLDAFIQQHQHVIDWLRIDAQQGNEKSQYYLGRILIEKRKREEGMALIEKSAAKNYSSALYYLIRSKRGFFGGYLPEKDRAEILDMYEKLVRMGHTNALYELGEIMLASNKVKAIHYFLAAAHRGKQAAFSRLVHCYLADGASEEELVQGMAWLIVCYYIDESLHSLEGVGEKYEHLLSKEQQHKVIKLADEYMEKVIMPNTIKESDWVYGLVA